MSQVPGHPFSESELYGAFRLFLPQAEALREARRATAPVDAVQERQVQRAGLPYSPVAHLHFTDDFLVVLSLLSEDLRRKVTEFRRSHNNASDASEFERRRSQLRPWVMEELRRAARQDSG